MSIDWTYWPSDPTWSDSSFWDYRPPWVRPARPGSMRWALQQTAAPTVEPVSLVEAKDHLRVDVTDDDAVVQNKLMAARDYVERWTGLSLCQQTWKLYLDRFPPADRWESWPWRAAPNTVLLPRWPIQSITSIQWTDLNGNVTTISSSDYLVDVVSRPARIVPATGKSWPSTPALAAQNGVVVTFVAGAANPGTIPPSLVQATLLILGDYYENREATVVDVRVSAQTLKAAELLLGIHRPVLVG